MYKSSEASSSKIYLPFCCLPQHIGGSRSQNTIIINFTIIIIHYRKVWSDIAFSLYLESTTHKARNRNRGNPNEEYLGARKSLFVVYHHRSLLQCAYPSQTLYNNRNTESERPCVGLTGACQGLSGDFRKTGLTWKQCRRTGFKALHTVGRADWLDGSVESRKSHESCTASSLPPAAPPTEFSHRQRLFELNEITDKDRLLVIESAT